MDPILRQFGFRPNNGGAPGAARRGSPGASVLVDLFPTYSRVVCGFEAITVANGTAAPASGSSAWYGLAKLNIPDEVNQPVFLDYAAATLSPTNPSATGTNLVWGELNGTGAAIVVGLNLPSQLNAWTAAPVYVPGVENSTNGNLFADTVSPYAAFFQFPNGDNDDTAPARVFLPEPMGKVAFRIPEGSTLDVALVVRGSQVVNSSGSDKTLQGHATVTLRLGLTRNPIAFGG